MERLEALIDSLGPGEWLETLLSLQMYVEEQGMEDMLTGLFLEMLLDDLGAER